MLPGTRRSRGGAWLLVLAVVLGAAYLLLQSWVPRLASQILSDQLSARLQQPLHVTVRANPFWRLLGGGWDSLQLSAATLHADRLQLEQIELRWLDGRVNLVDLATQGRLMFLRRGRLTLQATVTKSALLASLPKAMRAADPSLDVTPARITISGKASLAGMTVPYSISGRLQLADGGREVLFVPEIPKGALIQLQPIAVFSTADLPQQYGFQWRVDQIQLRQGAVRIAISGH